MKNKILIFSYEDKCPGGCLMTTEQVHDQREGSKTLGDHLLVIQCKICKQVILPVGITIETIGISDELSRELSSGIVAALTEETP